MTAPSQPAGPPERAEASDPGPEEGLGDDHGTNEQPIPQLYIACPLTGLDTNSKRKEETSHRIATVTHTIEEVTFGNRIEDERWPIRLHVPYNTSRPGSDGGLSPATVYETNFDALLSSDGLIVVTDEYCSAGVGQEFEWAVRAAIPVLYLSRVSASRQILGTPHNVDPRIAEDAQAVAAHVRHWLQKNRSQILNGPNRRADRELAYLGLMARLAAAWKQTPNPTAMAAQLNLHPGAINSIISSPARVALTPWWTICELAVLLGVRLEARRGLTYGESRAWVNAAEDGRWDPTTAERVRIFAATIAATDLELPAAWAGLHARMFDRPPADA
ncbi:hypothetical protein ACK280_26560 [Mycobacterium sherrisii]|uniref:hypothetical protein n=1 Tax=Mycobacterium sherrisii TaxID=243061 RepID=UPI0039771F7F